MQNGQKTKQQFIGGWCDKDGVRYYSNDPAKEVDDFVLYGEWNLDTYTIIYYLNGGQAITDGASTYTVLDNVQLPLAEREGYTFSGWYLTENFEGFPITNTDGFSNHLPIFAKFNPNQYTITFTIGDDCLDQVFLPQTVLTGESFVCSVPQVLEEYVFDGWEYDGRLLTLGNGSGFAPWNIASDITVTASVRLKVCYLQITEFGMIQWIGNNGVYDVEQPLSSGDQCNLEAIVNYLRAQWYTHVPGRKIVGLELVETVEESPFTSMTLEEQTVAFFDGPHPAPPPEEDYFFSIKENIEDGKTYLLKVIYNDETHVINFYVDDNAMDPFVGIVGTAIIYPDAVKAGCQFIGWVDSEEQPFTYEAMPDLTVQNGDDFSNAQANGEVYIEARFEALTFVVDFHTGVEILIPNRSIKMDEIINFPIPQYGRRIFLGWIHNETILQNGDKWNIDSNATLTAKWKTEYSITYVLTDQITVLESYQLSYKLTDTNISLPKYYQSQNCTYTRWKNQFNEYVTTIDCDKGGDYALYPDTKEDVNDCSNVSSNTIINDAKVRYNLQSSGRYAIKVGNNVNEITIYSFSEEVLYFRLALEPRGLNSSLIINLENVTLLTTRLAGSVFDCTNTSVQLNCIGNNKITYYDKAIYCADLEISGESLVIEPKMTAAYGTSAIICDSLYVTLQSLTVTGMDGASGDIGNSGRNAYIGPGAYLNTANHGENGFSGEQGKTGGSAIDCKNVYFYGAPGQSIVLHGGKGGKGGHGGRGGDGENGSKGNDSDGTYKASVGEWAGRGGTGGNGGDGGTGGNGGRGGNGGDDHWFWSDSGDCHCGGNGGNGGDSGKPSRGGYQGIGINNINGISSNNQNGFNGSVGSVGIGGSKGNYGNAGAGGSPNNCQKGQHNSGSWANNNGANGSVVYTLCN